MTPPMASDVLIQGLLTSNTEFKELLSGEVSGAMFGDGNFNFVNVERIVPSDEVIELCRENSRSASFLRVSFRIKQNKKTIKSAEPFIFSTRGSVEDLKLCTLKTKKR